MDGIITVTKLTKAQNVENRWYAELSDGTEFTADVNLIADFSLYTGRGLDREEADALHAEISLRGARERAMRLLSARQHSRKELVKRLVDKGERPEDAEAAADCLERLGMLNDGEYAGSIVRHYSKTGYGPARVRDELYRRGIPKELWEAALSENLPEDSDAINALIDKKLKGRRPGDKKELKRLTDMLLRRGFSYGDIKTALAEYDFSEEFDE